MLSCSPLATAICVEMRVVSVTRSSGPNPNDRRCLFEAQWSKIDPQLGQHAMQSIFVFFNGDQGTSLSDLSASFCRTQNCHLWAANRCDLSVCWVRWTASLTLSRSNKSTIGMFHDSHTRNDGNPSAIIGL